MGASIRFNGWTFEPLYVAELTCVFAFAVSWLTEGKRIARIIRNKSKALGPRPDLTTAPAATAFSSSRPGSC